MRSRRSRPSDVNLTLTLTPKLDPNPSLHPNVHAFTAGLCGWCCVLLAAGFWVVDLRDTTAFEASHYALTLHLPPERATSPDEREAARSQLFALCAEGAVGIAVLTAADPTAASGGRGVLSADETKRVVGEFVQAGFRRVGIVAGGFAALTREQKVNLVSGGDAVTAPDGADGMMEVRGRSTSKAAAAVGRMGMAAMKRVSGALPAQIRGRAKQAPI
jgi:hypothetical protein